MLKQKKQLITLIIFSILLLAPLGASAAGLVPCGGPNGESPCTFQDIFVLIARCTNFLIEWAAVFAVYHIIMSGFWMIADMGNEEALAGRKKSLTNSIVGFVMVMMAFVFINTAINLILGSKCSLDLTNPLSYLTANDQCQQATTTTTTTTTQ